MTWEELRPLAVEAVAVLIAAVVLWRKQHQTEKKLDETQQKVDDNTVKTEAAVDAANKASIEASAITRAQTDEYDVYVARRVIAALETLPECEPCRSEIAKIADRRRVWARRTSDPAPSKDPAR